MLWFFMMSLMGIILIMQLEHFVAFLMAEKIDTCTMRQNIKLINVYTINFIISKIYNLPINSVFLFDISVCNIISIFAMFAKNVSYIMFMYFF